MENLRDECSRGRGLHHEAVSMLRAMQRDREHEVTELAMELGTVSAGLEQKEEDIMTIQFDMVELQNKLREQAQQMTKNSDAFHRASKELAVKDGKLEAATARQEELLAQMNDVSMQLQGKVAQLSQELEQSRGAYQSLDEHTRNVVSRLEAERDALASELERVRAEATADMTALREQLRAQEAESARVHAELAHRAIEAQAKAEQDLQELRKKLQAELPSAPGDTALAGERSERDFSTLVPTLTQRSTTEHLEEQLATREAQLQEVAAALERSRLLERQARERVQEYRTSLELYREFGREEFLAGAVLRPPPDLRPESFDCSESDSQTTDISLAQCGSQGGSTGCSTLPFSLAVEEDEGPAVPSVLIAVDVHLGQVAGSAMLTVAPWQTRSDFDAVVRSFLEQHRVKPLFAQALVKFLEEVETEASSFPARIRADLAAIHSRFGNEDV